MLELLAGPWGPLLIFALRVVDVSMGTMRTLLVVRGHRVAAPVLSFFEILIWLVAAGAAIRSLASPLHAVAYAGGFACGTAVGQWVEESLALGIATVQAFTRSAAEPLADRLREVGYGVTEVAGEGQEGRVSILSTVVRRRHVDDVIAAIEDVDPDAFVTVYDDTRIRRGWVPTSRRK